MPRLLPPTTYATARLLITSFLAVALLTGSLAGPATRRAAAADPQERISNGTFDEGSAPWWNGANTAMRVAAGELCIDVAGGTFNPWDAIVGQSDILLEDGESYRYTFSARANRDTRIRTTVQLGAAPYTSPLGQDVNLSTTAQEFSYSFTSNLATQIGQVTFQLGGSDQDFTVCLDNISLLGGQAAPPGYTPDTGPRVRVNQVGYTIGQPKRATLVTDSAEPLAWELQTSAGAVVRSGVTSPYGRDAASRDSVHLIDFSNYDTPGSGYVLVADGQTSYPFSISKAIYDTLRYDALKYFYHNRSGIAITTPYVSAEYARPAGHVGVAPNQGDTNVFCGPGTGCSYSLDVSGGWYDAGDHGKYVVNGGISVWTLLNQYERAKHIAGAEAGALADGTLNIPESQNGVPDILDEARWELEFFLKMQVPAGQPKAGMVHHKMHDENWTGLPLPPHLDPQARYLRPPSTAATLNVAATAAQAARIWQPIDPAFAARLLAAAERAWAAAKANPTDYARSSDGTGGGAYDDGDVSDEFYWAAAELFISTGKSEYRSAAIGSPHFKLAKLNDYGFSWGSVAALGDLSLALVPSQLGTQNIAAVRSAIASYADAQLANIADQGYPIAYRPASGEYVWGSNSQVLNNMLIIAAAFDYTGNRAYLDGVFEGMDYLLGRNALNNSYITGYGTKYSQNQHHRFWANQIDSSLPNPAPGSVAGGPNQSIQDPTATKYLQGCAPQKCYIDDIQSWSTNEVTINWNAPLAWVAGFLSERSRNTFAVTLPDAACAAPVSISGSGWYPVSASTTCFKYVNPAFRHGALLTVRNGNTTATSSVAWTGARDQNLPVCAVQSATLNGNGAQVNNVAAAKDRYGAMYVALRSSVDTSMYIDIQNWQNGTGCR